MVMKLFSRLFLNFGSLQSARIKLACQYSLTNYFFKKSGEQYTPLIEPFSKSYSPLLDRQ